MDIKQIVKYLTSLNKIDFSGKESELNLLAKKYDKNKNSVFEQDEINEIKEDLLKYSEEDKKIDELNESEALKYFKYLSENNSFVGEDTNYGNELTDLFSVLHETGKRTDRKQYLLDYFVNEYGIQEADFEKYSYINDEFFELNDEQFERAKELFHVKNREHFFMPDTILSLCDLSDQEFKRAQELFYVKGRKDQFDGEDIIYLSKLDENQFKRAEKLFNIRGREEQLDGETIAELSKLDENQFKQAKKLFHVKNREQQFSGSEIIKLSKLSEYQFKRAEKLFHVKNREEQFSGRDIVNLCELNSEQFERAKTLFNVENRNSQFDSLDIVDLCRLTEEEFECAKTLFNIENREQQFSGSEIAQFSKLREYELKFAQKLFDFKQDGEYLSCHRILELAKMGDFEFAEEDIFNIKEKISGIENSKERFSDFDIAELCRLTEKEFEKIKPFLNIKIGDKYPDVYKLISFVGAVDKDELDWSVKYLFREPSNITTEFDHVEFYYVVKNRNKEIENILTQNTSAELHTNYFLEQTCIKTKGDGKDTTYNFDKNGIIEYSITQPISYQDYSDCIAVTVVNNRLNIKQEEIIDKSGIYMPLLENTTTYYDDNGETLKIIKMKKNKNDGSLNITQTNQDGTVIPIQWQAVDPDTGAKITERHLTSHDGTKTDYYCEEDSNFRISDYKITDEKGKILINLKQTFRQISDNKFISSINATNADKDTKIFEIEYKEDNSVVIFDKTNSTTTLINLNDYFSDEESIKELLPLIKRLPGHILLKFAENPFKFKYTRDENNSSWDPDTTTLSIGNYQNSIDKKESMYSALVHELGHYIDFYNKKMSKTAYNKDFEKIYNHEYNLLTENETINNRESIRYLLESKIMALELFSDEAAAETHAIMYLQDAPILNRRRLYFAQNFPKLSAELMKFLLSEEGIKTP